MKLKVFKYPVSIEGQFELEMPQGAKSLKFEAQNGQLCLWALVDIDRPTLPRKFQLASTGYTIMEGMGYVGTAFLHGQDLVFHLFEECQEVYRVPSKVTVINGSEVSV